MQLLRVYTPRTTGGLLPTTGASRTQGTRSSRGFRILTVKLGLSTAPAHATSLGPVLEAQKIRARAQRVPPVGSLVLSETISTLVHF